MHSKAAFSGITLVLATSALGCYSTWDIAPVSLTRLDGFRAGETRPLPTLVDEEHVTFSSNSEIHFVGEDGKEAQVAFRLIDFQDNHFVGEREQDGARIHVDLSRLTKVQVRNVSDVKTTLAVTGILVGGGGTLVGMTVLAALMGTGSGRPLRCAESAAPVRAPVFFDEPPGKRAHAASTRFDAATRARLLAHWAHEASAECASIPAFWALARDLQRASAPTNLVRATLHAARDEATHTRLCVERAETHAGTRAKLVVPATPPARDTSPEALLERLVLEAFWDGCIAEGAAAALARRSAHQTTDEKTRLALHTIADDEQRHADLAQDIIRFGLAHGGRSIRNALAESIERRTWEEEQRLVGTHEMSQDDRDFDESLAYQHGLPRRNDSQDARIEVWEKSRSLVASWMAYA